MTLSLITGLTYAIGIVAIAIGLLAMILPSKMSEGFGIPVSGVGAQYVRGLGARDVFIGSIVLLLGHSQEWTLIGYVCLCIAFVAASDFYTVFMFGKRRASLAHLAGFVLSLIFSVIFLKFPDL